MESAGYAVSMKHHELVRVLDATPRRSGMSYARHEFLVSDNLSSDY